jgi:hypothetical protein
LDQVENGLGTRFTTARDRLQALSGAPDSPERQQAEKDYNAVASEVDTAKLRPQGVHTAPGSAVVFDGVSALRESEPWLGAIGDGSSLAEFV